MRIRPRVSLSLEAIAYQTNPLFFKTLVGHFTNMRNSSSGTQTDVFAAVTEKEITAAIDHFVGCPAKFVILDDSPTDYAFLVLTPVFTQFHPIGMENQPVRYSPAAFAGAVKAIKDSPEKFLTGWVDRRTGKLKGLFRKLEVTFYIGRSVFEDGGLTPEMMAAVLLHECGHVVSFYESLAYKTSTSWAIRYGIEALQAVPPDSPEAVMTLNKLSDILSVDDVTRQGLLDARNKEEAITLVIVDEANKGIKSALGTTLADNTGFEFLADQFAVRQGAGVYLAQALDYMNRRAGSASTQGIARYALVEVAKITGAILGTVITAGTLLPALWQYGQYEAIGEIRNVYDKPVDRLKRIRADMIQSLKGCDNKDIAARLTADIQQMDDAIKRTNQRNTVFEMLNETFNRKLRLKRGQVTRVQELEALFNNPLFIRQAQLAQLADSQ